jgi:hypothetical protein
MPHEEPDPPSTEAPGQSKNLPNQRGTSSGEIGQNPVEIIGKKTVPPGNNQTSDATEKKPEVKPNS